MIEIEVRNTRYSWITFIVNTGNTRVEEDIELKAIPDFIEMLKQAVEDAEWQLIGSEP